MIDALTEADALAAASLSAGFGWPHRVEDWRWFLRLGQGVAWREAGALIGTAMLFGQDDAHASVGLVQVAPGQQGRGIGKRLMQAVLALAGRRSLLLHATAEGAGLYAALGFEPAGWVEQWQRPAGVAVAQAVRGAGITPASAIEAVLDLDRQALGLERHRLLAGMMQEGACVVEGTAGYAMRRRFGRGDLIGPVVAAEERGAIALVAALERDGFLRVDVAAGAGAGLAAYLAGRGLVRVDRVQAMVRGTFPTPPGPALPFALGAQAFG